MADEWIRLSLEEWQQQGRELFGPDVNDWKYVCPACGHVQTRQDWLDLGMNDRQVDERVGFSCIGRWLNPLGCATGFEPSTGTGCDYAGGLVPNISPITIIIAENDERPTFGWYTGNADSVRT